MAIYRCAPCGHRGMSYDFATYPPAWEAVCHRCASWVVAFIRTLVPAGGGR